MSYLNDPRVLFAAERTALAWSRTSVTLMALGFTIERFGMFIRVFATQKGLPFTDNSSFWIALSCILMAVLFSLLAMVQYKNFIRTLKPEEIPAGHNIYLAFIINAVIAVLASSIAVFISYIWL